MGSNVVVVEGLSPDGHTLINNFYLKSIHESVSRVYIGISLKKYYSDIENVVFFDDCGIFHSSRVRRLISFLGNSFSMLISARRLAAKTVLFLSYDPMGFFLVVYFARFLGLKIYAFEHNTIPTNRSKMLCQRLSFSWLYRICYRKAVVNLYQRLGGQAILIPHPIVNRVTSTDLSYSSLPKRYFDLKKRHRFSVLCPSGSASVDRVFEVAKKHSDVLFFVKAHYDPGFSNVVVAPFFDHYFDLVSFVDFFYLPFGDTQKKFLRVSGPFFEAIGANKKVILEQGAYLDNFKGTFPDNILESDDQWDFDPIVNHPFDVDSYNHDIALRLKELFYD